MKRRYTNLMLIICGILFPFLTSAKTVSKAKAIETANLFFYGNIPTKAGSGVSLKWSSNELAPATKSGDTAPSFYVFSGNGNQGFVIISGDDVIKPILGYSFNVQAPQSDNLPDGLRQWLAEIAEHIDESRVQGTTQSADVKAEWDAVAKGSIQNVWVKTRSGETGGLLETPEWGQGSPFNKECPMDGVNRSAAGCVATAISEIMYYHKWPDAGIGYTEQYKTDDKKFTINARNLEIPYEWHNMLKKYTGVSYTNAQANAVARLIADVGAAYQADYRYGATSAVTGINQMFKYFKYDSGMSRIARKDYFAEQYDNLLKKEIDAKRPILYSGRSDSDGGHAFVLDGYDNTGNFHINWGWNGESNGYFAITKHDYKNKQQAFIYIMPATGNNNVPEYWITLYNDGIVPEITDTEKFKANEYFMVKLLLLNRTAIDFKGYIRVAVINKGGNLKEWAMDPISAEIYAYNSGKKHTINPILNCKLQSEPEIGDKLAVFYSTDAEEWKQTHPDHVDWDSNIQWEYPIADTHYIRESTSAQYNHNKRTFTFTYKKGVVPALLVEGKEITEGVKADSTKVTIDVTKLEGKKLILRLEKKKELEEIELSVEPVKK